jgi:hypothetical protein
MPILTVRADCGPPPTPAVPRGSSFLALWFLVFVPGHVRGQDVPSRPFVDHLELVSSPVWSLTQDRSGFLWIGAQGGLLRFDGTELRHWAPDVLDDHVFDVAHAPSGDLVAVTGSGRLFRITGHGVDPVAQACVRGEDAVVAVAMDAGRRDESAERLEEVEGREAEEVGTAG